MAGDSQWERMVRGLEYYPGDPHLQRLRQRALELCLRLNSLSERPSPEYLSLCRELLGSIGEGSVICANFFCDYGLNIRLGAGCYINYSCVFLDCAPITLGEGVLVGPQCGLYTAVHPLESEARSRGIETAKPITLGDRVWLGGGVTILPGVEIGERTVVGAGSVVTRSLPAGVLAMGNPCRVVRSLE